MFPVAKVDIQLIRHATLRIAYGDTVVLVDPMLSEQGALDPVQDSPFPRRNPIVPLRLSVDDVLKDVGLVLVTHTHRDHWDDAAVKALPKEVRVLCQPPDEQKIKSAGFGAAAAVDRTVTDHGIEISRASGEHGTGEVGKRMGPVSGFVLARSGLPTIYIAGDTIWCKEVETAIGTHKPDVIVVNAGAAQFNSGGPITMTADDVVSVVGAAGAARVIAVHMNCWNHCVLTRAGLADALKKSGVARRVAIPDDSETVSI